MKLKPISEEALEARIEKMNSKRLSTNPLISGELNWLRTKRKNYKVRQVFKEMIEFRREVKAAIFPCVSFDKIYPWRADNSANTTETDPMLIVDQ